MMDSKAYRKCVEDLLWDALSLAGIIASQLPQHVRPGSKFARAGGSQWNNDALRIVAQKLDDVTYRFDQVQHALGLWEHDARFGHPPAGSTNLQTEETPPMATKKAQKSTKPKTAPAKKPGASGNPAKQPPRHGGGTSYNDSRHE